MYNGLPVRCSIKRRTGSPSYVAQLYSVVADYQHTNDLVSCLHFETQAPNPQVNRQEPLIAQFFNNLRAFPMVMS